MNMDGATAVKISPTVDWRAQNTPDQLDNAGSGTSEKSLTQSMGTFRVSDSVSEQVQLRLKTLCQRTPDDKSQSMLLRKIEDCSPKIALKIVTCSSPTEITAIDRELNIHEKLGSQKGIVPMGRLEAHSADYRVGVMPLYDGDLLELCRDQVYGPEDITHWFTDIGYSLKQLHDFGLVHSDLKLENILYRIVDGKVEVALADFDLSDIQGRPLRGDFLPSAALQPMGNTRHFLLSILTDFDPENSKG
ncbi:MAG: protein kinase domain-containing protein [Endozoicomonas sp.]|uniref:protein kinase domain-containing protein n=1 Tax=Endozoicomonas sp. TaxID=1892382 RepID=UPI003D9AD0DA